MDDDTPIFVVDEPRREPGFGLTDRIRDEPGFVVRPVVEWAAVVLVVVTVAAVVFLLALGAFTLYQQAP